MGSRSGDRLAIFVLVAWGGGGGGMDFGVVLLAG